MQIIPRPVKLTGSRGAVHSSSAADRSVSSRRRCYGIYMYVFTYATYARECVTDLLCDGPRCRTLRAKKCRRHVNARRGDTKTSEGASVSAVLNSRSSDCRRPRTATAAPLSFTGDVLDKCVIPARAALGRSAEIQRLVFAAFRGCYT